MDIREPGLRLHIHRDTAFIEHPVVLEGPATTYLVSWGSMIVNANVKRYLTGRSDRPTDGVFHLFVKNLERVSVARIMFREITHNQVVIGHMVLSRQTTVRCG